MILSLPAICIENLVLPDRRTGGPHPNSESSWNSAPVTTPVHQACVAALTLALMACQAPVGAPPPDRSHTSTVEKPVADSLAEQVERLYSLGRLDTALGLCQTHLAEHRSTPPTSEQAKLLNGCGSVFRRTQRSHQTVNLHLEALEIARQLGDRQIEASSLARLGLAYKYGGETQAALEVNREALGIFEALGHTASVATLYHNTGSLLLSIGQLEPAKAELDRALELRRKADDPRGLGSTLTKLATLHDLRNETQHAVALLQEALVFRREAGDPLGEIVTLDRLGVILASRGDLAAAVGPFEKAIATATALGDRASQINTISNLGQVYLALGHVEDAKRTFEHGLHLARSHEDRRAQADLKIGLSAAIRDLGDLSTAQALLEEALDEIDTDRSRAPVGMFRNRFLGIHLHAFELYIDLLFERHLRAPEAGFDLEAFWATERARARGLLDLINTGPLRPRPGIPPTIFKPLEALRRDLARLELDRLRQSRHSSAPRQASKESLTQRQRELVFEFRELRATLWKYTMPAQPTLAPRHLPHPSKGGVHARQVLTALQAHLDDTTILSYFLGPKRGFLFIIEAGGLRMVELAGRERINKVAGDLRRALYLARDRPRTDLAATIANELSRLILDPAALPENGHRLAVIADGWLQYIPFSILPTRRRAPAQRDASRPMIGQPEIVYLPSASVLLRLRQRSHDRRHHRGHGDQKHRVAVVAPGFDHDDSEFLSIHQSPLPGSRAEVTAILDMLAPHRRLPLLGPVANKKKLLETDFSDVGILHLATHGLLHPRFPELSALILAPSVPGSQAESELLHLFEIIELNLPIEMVVLSACETALGELMPGEGLVGMSHGFLASGATRVVVSLWRIDDRATEALMTEFYRALWQTGLSPSAALHQAQNRLRTSEEWSAPYYWAGFVLQGDWI